MAIIIKPPVSGGGGAVDSVNGETGVVVLTTDNIDAGLSADRQYFTSALQSDLDAKADQTSLDTVQSKTLYSNSYYVNENVNDIQTVVDAIAGGNGAYAIYMSAGSYSGSTLTISDAPSGMDIIGPEHPTSAHICELVSRGLTISGASTTRVRMNNINIEGALLINGTQGRHYFKNVIFDSTVTINNATANFITFEQCSFAGGISIASNVTATVYFDRCALGNQFITSSRSGAGSPLLTILTECSGVNALQTNLTSNVALVGRTGFNSGSVVQYQNSDSYVYDLNNGLSTSFSGSYSELRNKPTIPTSSDDLTEGSTNLFYTTSRFDTRLATKTTDNLTQGSTNLYFTNSLAKSASVVNSMAGSETDQAPSVSSVKAYYTAGSGISLSSGQISSTITQYTDTDADARITLQKGANNGICELDANGLVPTNHLPPLAITDVHVVADATERLALVAQEGDVAIQTDNSTSWIYSGTAWVQFGLSGGVLSVNGATGTVSLTTSDISEGTNLYYTSTRWDDRLALKTTDNLTEGSTNKYFSSSLAKSAAVVNSMAGTQTDQAPSVSSVKSYYTAGTGISLSSGTIASTITQYTDTNAKTAAVVNSMAGTQTDQAPSVSSVKSYYTAGTGISLSSGTIASTITQYTDEQAQDQAASIFTSGTHTGISYSYVDASNRIDSTVSLSGFSIDALSDVDTTTAAPTNGQALAWQSSSSKWIPQTISGGGGGSRVAITEKTSSFQITDPVDASVIQEHYAMNSASSTTFTLPTAAGNNGLSYIITRVGTGAVSVATVSSQTISGLSSLSITSQWSSVTVKSNGTNWIIF